MRTEDEFFFVLTHKPIQWIHVCVRVHQKHLRSNDSKLQRRVEQPTAARFVALGKQVVECVDILRVASEHSIDERWNQLPRCVVCDHFSKNALEFCCKRCRRRWRRCGWHASKTRRRCVEADSVEHTPRRGCRVGAVPVRKARAPRVGAAQPEEPPSNSVRHRVHVHDRADVRRHNPIKQHRCWWRQ